MIYIENDGWAECEVCRAKHPWPADIDPAGFQAMLVCDGWLVVDDGGPFKYYCPKHREEGK